jgi:predicted ester cyclase
MEDKMVAQNIKQEEVTRVAQQVIEQGFNQGNYAALDELMPEKIQEHQAGLHADREGFKQDIQFIRNGFPDFHLTIEEMLLDGDRVWVRSTARGTNTGPFMGPPTGKPIEVVVFDICRVQEGRIVEHWGVPDRFTLLQQIGRLPGAKKE